MDPINVPNLRAADVLELTDSETGGTIAIRKGDVDSIRRSGRNVRLVLRDGRIIIPAEDATTVYARLFDDGEADVDEHLEGS